MNRDTVEVTNSASASSLSYVRSNGTQLGIDPEVRLTLVDRRNFHLFQPLLYQVATGALSPGDIAQPLRSVLRKQRNTTVILGEAVGIDPDRRQVLMADGGPIE